MTLRQLELFVAIAETGSFSRGAYKVFLTQSTVSQHVADLEAEIGAQLFDRLGRGVTLTAGGELFLRHARRILAERDALRQSMAAFQGLEQAQLTIGASNIPANYLVPPLLSILHAEHPGISLTMLTGDTSEVLDLLVRAEVELAIVGRQVAHKSVEFESLKKDPLALVVGRAHRWAGRTQVTLPELLAEPVVIRESGSGSGQSLEDALRLIGRSLDDLNIAARLGSNEAVIQAVASGFGCAFVSELSVHRSLGQEELRRMTVESLQVERQIWLAKLKARSLSPAAEIFIDLLNRYCRSEMR